jgi:hypothetical protein
MHDVEIAKDGRKRSAKANPTKGWIGSWFLIILENIGNSRLANRKGNMFAASTILNACA